MLALKLPLGAVGHPLVFQLVDGRVVDLALDDAIAASANDTGDRAISGDVLGVVPGVEFFFGAWRYGHAADLQRWRHPTLRVFRPLGEDLLAGDADAVDADDRGGHQV